MQKWEYMILVAEKQPGGEWQQTFHNATKDTPSTTIYLFEILNAWGDKGWELVSRDTLDGRRLEMTFKRPKQG